MAQATRLDDDVALFIDETATGNAIEQFSEEMAKATVASKQWAKAVRALMTAGHTKADANVMLRDQVYGILETDADGARGPVAE